jgi:Acyl-ACP thioesterase
MNNNLFQGHFTVSWQDIGKNGNLTLKAFANFLQETAWQHAQELGFGFDYMADHQAVWVLLGIKAEFYKQPQWHAEILMQSWHKGYKGVTSYRDFILFDKDNNVIAKAATEWVLINHETRRIVRPNILDPFIQTRISDDVFPDFKIDASEAGEECESSYKVTYSDMDFNGHTNNSRYFEWIENLFEPLNEHHKSISRLEIKYQAECFMNDELVMKYRLTDKLLSIQTYRKEDQKKIFAANIVLN